MSFSLDPRTRRFHLWNLLETTAASVGVAVAIRAHSSTWLTVVAGLTPYISVSVVEWIVVKRNILIGEQIGAGRINHIFALFGFDIAAPPKAAKFILLLIPIRDREHLVGDLEEEYETIMLPEFGARAANFWYWNQVLTSLLPLLFRQVRRFLGLLLFWKIRT